ncbi:methyltransferase domain-containing protein [Halobacteria archaeon AArc-dxtr1]|nr:methyltransferase domain-containing protein [Halobacteria archaeon AArc-dxtr1]
MEPAGTDVADGWDAFETDGVTADDGSSDGRGQRLYDWWGRRAGFYDAVIAMTGSLREDAFEALASAEGETILDLGCGPGTNFEVLRAGVGETGAVVGLDYSPEMSERAGEQVAEEGWSNVHVVRGDATQSCGPPATFDAAVTTFALHTMADVDAVVENVYEALCPGGRFVVSDAREIQRWPASLLNPVYERVIARAVNHRRDQDPVGALESTFDSVEIVSTYDAGSGYLAVAQKQE